MKTAKSVHRASRAQSVGRFPSQVFWFSNFQAHKASFFVIRVSYKKLTFAKGAVACMCDMTLTWERSQCVCAWCVAMTIMVADDALIDICKKKNKKPERKWIMISSLRWQTLLNEQTEMSYLLVPVNDYWVCSTLPKKVREKDRYYMYFHHTFWKYLFSVVFFKYWN